MTSLTLRGAAVPAVRLAIAAFVSMHLGVAYAEDAKPEPAKVETGATEAIKVTIDNFTFAPALVTVKVGTTVTWTNHDDIPHTVVSAGKFRSKTMDTDDSFSFTFTSAGEYKYFCSLHPHMTGTIKVE